MSNDFQQGNQYNPYQSTELGQGPGTRPMNTAKVQAPAIALIIVGSLSLIMSIYSVVNALVAVPPEFPPDAPEFVVQMAKNSVGPVAAAIQVIFVLISVVILFGGIQMLRLKSWGMALTAAILAMIDFGSCCCVIGLPIGIWALIVLQAQDVKQAFAMSGGR
ncbi:MAG: hypothetical protein ABL921_04865 [Pirellula sp.]